MIQLDLTVLAPTMVVLTGVLTIFTVAILPIIRKMRNLTNGWDDFMRDWKGEEGDAGHDPSPGVMERLNNIDGEFKKNSGSTLKDAINRIEKKLNEVDERLQKGDERMTRIEDNLGKK